MKVEEMSYGKMLLWLTKRYLPEMHETEEGAEKNVRRIATPLLQGDTDKAKTMFMKSLAREWSASNIDELSVKAMYHILDAEPEEAKNICIEAGLL